MLFVVQICCYDPGTAQRAVGTNNMHKYGQISHYVLATVADDERVGRIDHPSRDTLHIFI